jgi:hypothetical protein
MFLKTTWWLVPPWNHTMMEIDVEVSDKAMMERIGSAPQNSPQNALVKGCQQQNAGMGRRGADIGEGYR